MMILFQPIVEEAQKNQLINSKFQEFHNQSLMIQVKVYPRVK